MKNNKSYRSLMLIYAVMDEVNKIMSNSFQIIEDKELDDEDRFYLLLKTLKDHGLKIEKLVEADNAANDLDQGSSDNNSSEEPKANDNDEPSNSKVDDPLLIHEQMFILTLLNTDLGITVCLN